MKSSKSSNKSSLTLNFFCFEGILLRYSQFQSYIQSQNHLLEQPIPQQSKLCLIILEDISNLEKFTGDRINVAIHLSGTCSKRTVHADYGGIAKISFGSFTDRGLGIKHVQWLNRNSKPDKDLDTISITSTKPTLLACSIPGTIFHRTDCLFSTCPTSR
jgi:hypothetical protein